MNDKTFVDSNILIYAYDLDAGTKREVAKHILGGLWEGQTGVLSVQVLQEFYVSTTRKILQPLPKDSARDVIREYFFWCTEATTPAEISAAFRIEDELRTNSWDALIVSAALKCGATRILSEDFSAGQRIAGILLENPFVGA